jgi:hypothetical protein
MYPDKSGAVAHLNPAATGNPVASGQPLDGGATSLCHHRPRRIYPNCRPFYDKPLYIADGTTATKRPDLQREHLALNPVAPDDAPFNLF